MFKTKQLVSVLLVFLIADLCISSNYLRGQDNRPQTTLSRLQIANGAQHENLESDTRGPKKGRLVLHGGGVGMDSIGCFPLIEKWAREGLPKDEILRVVVIPTADPKFDNSLWNRTKVVVKASFAMASMGDVRVSCIHTRDRSKANNESFCNPIQRAHVVMIPGGFQRLLHDAYAGTNLLDELWSVLDRGGMIVGASAGAIVQGTVFSRTPAGQKGFGFLTNSVIDVHVSERHRNNYLVKKFRGERFNRQLLGIGIDEGVMVLIEQDVLKVYGNKSVFITDASNSDGNNAPRMETLSNGDSYDLRNRRRISPAETKKTD